MCSHKDTWIIEMTRNLQGVIAEIEEDEDEAPTKKKKKKKDTEKKKS